MSYSEQKKHLLRIKEPSQNADQKLFTENERWRIENSRSDIKDKDSGKNARDEDNDDLNASERKRDSRQQSRSGPGQ